MATAKEVSCKTGEGGGEGPCQSKAPGEGSGKSQGKS